MTRSGQRIKTQFLQYVFTTRHWGRFHYGFSRNLAVEVVLRGQNEFLPTQHRLIPSTFTSDIYVDLAGTLTLVASSQMVRWFYKDSAASGSLIPVEPTDNGTAWDAIGNSCTAA